jgi:hypothetical protein
MSLSAYQLALRASIEQGDVTRLRALLAEGSDELQTVSPLQIREVDYLLYYPLAHNKNDKVALELCQAVFDAGAGPNRSFYGQTQTGFLQDAAGRSLDLVKLFVQRGARINHDLFGRPACWSLISAVCAGRLDVVRYLVEQGAVVNFVNVWGMSPLDYAAPGREGITPIPNGAAVHAYLLSVGAKSGADLPRDHLPPPEPAAEEQISIYDHVSSHFGQAEYLPVPHPLPGGATLHFWAAPRWNNDERLVGLLTDGMAHRPMPVPDGVADGVRRAELAFVVPKAWGLDEKTVTGPRFAWIRNWLIQLAVWPFETGSYYRRANVVANGDPPEPLAPDWPMTCLLVRTADNADWGRWTRDDGETVELMIVTPLYTAERDYEREHGIEALVERLDAKADQSTFPGRMDVTIPPEG